MLDETMVALLGTGCGLIVASVSSDGEPRAARGWGIAVLDADLGHVRVLSDATDEQTLANVAAGGAVAVTAASVRTLSSLQMKGRSTGVGTATAGDVALSERYCEQFVTDVHETDRVPVAQVRRIIPPSLAAWELVIEELFDQTPGPGAGGSVAR